MTFQGTRLFAKDFSSSTFVLTCPFLAPAVAAVRSRGVGEGGNAFAVIIINKDMV